jgi:hypothetical protein
MYYPVVIAAGNNGADPIYTLADPSRAEDSISVASVENDFYYGPNFKASGIDYFIRKCYKLYIIRKHIIN